MPGYLPQMFPPVDNNGWAQSGFQLGDMQNIARQQAMLNNKMAMDEMARANELHPLEFQIKQEKLRGDRATNDKTIFDLEQAERLKEPSYNKKLQELLAGAKEHELKQAVGQLEMDMLSPDKKVADNARRLYMMTSDMVKLQEAERLKTAGQMQVEGVRQAGMNSRDDAKLKAKNSVLASIDQQLVSLKGKPIETYTLLSRILSSPGLDPADYARYSAQLAAVTPMAEALINKGGIGKPVVGPDGKYTIQPGVSLPVSPGVASREARQAPVYKQEDLEATARKYGITVEEVKARLGAK